MKNMQAVKNPFPLEWTGNRLAFSLFLFFFVWWGNPLPAGAQFEEITSRSFAVHFRTMDEVIPLAKALLSNKGTITENRSMQVMVVTDYPSYLNRIDSLLFRYDLPLHQVRITVQLLLGSTATETENILRNPEIEAILGDRFDFNRIVPVEKSVIITEEHKQTALELANGQFIVAFTPVYLPLEAPRIELRDFVLVSIRKALGGEERKQLLSASIAMEHGEEHAVGAMKYGLNDETLVVIVRIEIMD